MKEGGLGLRAARDCNITLLPLLRILQAVGRG